MNYTSWLNWASLVAQMVKHLPTMWETPVRSPSWEDPLEKELVAHSSILAGKSHGRRSLAGYSQWSHRESNTTEQLTFPLSVIRKQPVDSWEEGSCLFVGTLFSVSNLVHLLRAQYFLNVWMNMVYSVQ